MVMHIVNSDVVVYDTKGASDLACRRNKRSEHCNIIKTFYKWRKVFILNRACPRLMLKDRHERESPE